MKVSLIIPTKNEAGAVGRVIIKVPKKLVNEIIVVDGHSIDNTAIEVKDALRPGIDKFLVQRDEGFGRAVLEGFDIAGGDVVIIMNGDGSHDPKDIPTLIKNVREGQEYVLASRYAPGGRSEDDTIITYIGNKFFTWLTNVVHGTHVFDSLYFFTAITRSGLDKLQLSSPGFELCVEMLIKAHRAGLKFAEVPVVERARFAGRTKVNAFLVGLKILKMIVWDSS